jgi:hypothetical protein
MVFAPAWVFGLLVVFVIGYGITTVVISVITKLSTKPNVRREKSTSTRYSDNLKEVNEKSPLYVGERKERRSSTWTEEQSERVRIFGGFVAVGLVVLLLFVSPQMWARTILPVLVVLGILFAIAMAFLNKKR